MQRIWTWKIGAAAVVGLAAILAVTGSAPGVDAAPPQETPHGSAIGPKGCDLSTLRGAYLLHGSGELLGAPFGLVGRIDFSGDGRATGRLSETKAALGPVERTTVEGSYTLDASCHGEVTATVQHELWTDHHTLDFYATASGDRIVWILTGTWFDHVHEDQTGVTVDLGLEGLTETLMSDASAHRHIAVATGVAERE